MSKHNHSENKTSMQVVQLDNTHMIATSIAMGFMSIMAGATNDMLQYLTSGEATPDGILSLLNDILADIQTRAKKFQTLTGNFDRICEEIGEGKLA